MLNPPILVPMEFSKPAYLYISPILYALGEILCHKDDDKKEKAIYYLSRILHVYETRYTPMKKLCFGIVFSTEKLRHYLLYYTTYVVSPMDPMKCLIAKQHLYGRIVKWLVFL